MDKVTELTLDDARINRRRIGGAGSLAYEGEA
jgi:hypothetical protein